jgi:predicted aldo/keto reductase-like oxidoreductase
VSHSPSLDRQLNAVCFGCKYCLPCPSGVDIPEVFSIYNDYLLYGDEKRSRPLYSFSPASPNAAESAKAAVIAAMVTLSYNRSICR